MMGEQSIEFVKGIYGAFAQGDVPAVLGSFADGIEWYEAEGMPYGGLHRGGEAVAQNVFGPIAEDVEGFAVVPEEYMGSGDTVKDLVVGSGISFSDRGARELKGVPGEWRLFAVEEVEASPSSRLVPDTREHRPSDRMLAGATRKAPRLVRRVFDYWDRLGR
jgi:ketosteroid isomerase-like protein